MSHKIPLLMFLAIVACFGGAWAASTNFVAEMSKGMMLAAASRCAYNGDLPAAFDGSFKGLANLRKVTRTGVFSFTIVCENGAHFYDTMRIDTPKPREPEAAAASDPGSGKPPTTESTTRRPAS